MNPILGCIVFLIVAGVFGFFFAGAKRLPSAGGGCISAIFGVCSLVSLAVSFFYLLQIPPA